jgi:hypothetical protein
MQHMDKTDIYAHSISRDLGTDEAAFLLTPGFDSEYDHHPHFNVHNQYIDISDLHWSETNCKREEGCLNPQPHHSKTPFEENIPSIVQNEQKLIKADKVQMSKMQCDIVLVLG